MVRDASASVAARRLTNYTSEVDCKADATECSLANALPWAVVLNPPSFGLDLVLGEAEPAMVDAGLPIGIAFESFSIGLLPSRKDTRYVC